MMMAAAAAAAMNATSAQSCLSSGLEIYSWKCGTKDAMPYA
jgi:hypothetical protein